MSKNNINKLTRDWNAPILESVSFKESSAPNKTGVAYKVFKVKNGKLYPPMVANPGGEDTPIGVWLDAQEGEFAGLSKTGRPQVKSTGSGNLAYRLGWHLGDVPRAKQFDRLNKETGEYEFPKDFVWAECEYAMDVDYQKDSDEQGYMRTKVDDQGNVTTYRSDKYQHSLAGLPRIPKDGYYRYRTNPNPDTVPWVITGKMKVNRLLSDEEVNKILQSQGIEPIHRQGGDKTLAELGLQESIKRKTRVWGNPLLESKEDRQKFIDWLKQEYEEELAINLCDNFIKLKNSIKSPYNDFYYWMKNESPKVFFDYMNELMNNYVKKQQIKQSEKDGARLVYQDKNWKVYEITTYEASAKYGKNTKWCIAGSKRWTNGENGNKYFSDYTGNGIRFYYFINKNGEKWALAVYPNDSYCEIYNAEDVKVAYIPNAPQIDEIKVNYNDHSDRNILVNAIMSGQIDEDILFTLMGEVIYDNMGFYTEIFNNPHELVDFLDENIPDGYLEHEAVENGDLSVEDYEDMFDASYDEYWDGDLPQIDFNYDDTGSLGYTSKEALLKPENFNNHKYWFCIDYEGGEGWNITACDDYIKLYALCSEACAIDQWDDAEVDDFYEDSEIDGASRADIFGIMCANQLLWDIRNGKISKNVVSNLGLSKDYLNLNDAQESLVMKEDLNSDIDLVSSSFGTSTKPFMGPSYILPNGEFLKIRNANINITDSGSGDRGLIIHLDVQKWLNKQHNKEVNNVDNIDLEEVCIRVNTDQLEHYIVLPKQRPNDEQFESLKDWIDYFYAKTNTNLTLVSYYGPTTTYFKGAVAEDIIDDIKDYYARGMFFESTRTKRQPIATLYEGYTPKEGDFPFTLEDIENKYPDLISNTYQPCGNAFIMPDGRFILSGNRFEVHADFAWQCLMDIANMSEKEIENEWDTSKILEAFTIYFDLIRVNDGSNKGVEDRAYFVIPKNRITSSQQGGLLEYLDYIVNNKYSQKIYTLQAFVGNNLAHNSWDLAKDITSDEIMDDVKGALIRGYFVESLQEDISESDQEILNILDETFGQGDRIVDWSTYILPNGHCLGFFSDEINDEYLSDSPEEWFTEDEGEHARCWEFMSAMWPEKFESMFYCEEFLDKYCIKVNVNYPYVSLALGNITSQQWDSLKKIMECLLEHPLDYYWSECPNDEKGMVSILTKKGDTWLNLFELGLDEFMKEVREGYTRGFFENLNEYMDEVAIEDNREEFPVYATDEAYRLKNLLAKGDKAYRIYYDASTGTFYFQDAFGNRTHGDMLELARDNGWITDASSLGHYLDTDWDGYMVFIPFNYDKQLRWHTRLGIDDYYDCRVYDFGVMFVRDRGAYNNPLFSALGTPERELYYDTGSDTVTLTKDEKTYDVDVYYDLDDEPNNAISIDVTNIGKEKPQKDKNDLDYIEDMLKSLDFDIGGSGKYEEKEYINFANRFYDEYQLVKENLWTLKDEEGNIIKDSLDFNNLDSWDVISSLQNAKDEDDDLDDIDDDLLDLDDLDYDDIERESLQESKADLEKFRQWCGNDELYNRFMKLRPRLANIRFTDGSKGDDIYFWMKNNTPKDLEDTLQDLEATPTKKEREKRAQEGAKLLYNQNGWKVYKIETQEASQKYGKGSMWCISGEGGYDLGDGYWEGHEDNTYFFIHGNEKYALIWHKGDSVWDIWNEEDEIIPYIPNAPKVDGLPDISKLPDFITRNVAKLYNISVDDIKDVKSASNDPELMELFLDYDSKQNYQVELKNGTTKYCYVEEFTDFIDVTEEIEELMDEYF